MSDIEYHTNPVATADQFSAERDVLRMWGLDDSRAARAQAGFLWSRAHGIDVPRDARGSFDEAMDEYVTNYLFRAAASDPYHPRFVRNFMPAYEWRGQAVPGARMGGDNPDTCYRLAGIAHGETYVVRGRPAGRAPANVSFMLAGNWGTSVAISTLEQHQLVTASDGGFEITIGPNDAAGSANHLRTAPHVKFLFVRDTLNDWATEQPYALDIHHAGGTDRDPLTIADMTAQARFRMNEDVPLYYWFSRLWMGLEPNTLRPPGRSGAVGGPATQATSAGIFRLGPGEAAIITIDPANATYLGLACYDWWYRSIDSAQRQSSLTRASAVIGPDGRISCVMSAFDPGVANWLDTAGLSAIGLCCRWQGLAQGGGDEALMIDSKIVDRASLKAAMPRATRWIDPAQREARRIERLAAYARRLAA